MRQEGGVLTVPLVGDVGPGAEPLFSAGLCGISTANRRAVPFAEARKTAQQDLAFAVENLLRYTASLP